MKYLCRQMPSRSVCVLIFGIVGSTACILAYADELPAVTVNARHYDNAIATSNAASQGNIQAELLENRAILRPGEVLEAIPGMVVTQHSGDGKANQYFLRGFNLDHGTDFATTVDGIPVNMPTHAHGQGFSDLNFLIPELIDRIEYRKGPYFATHGDFATAGAADISYKSHLDAPFTQLTIGKNGYQRALGAINFEASDATQWLAAAEWMGNDGPWTVPEALQRNNAILRMTTGTRTEGSSMSLMAYKARWNATDQIPQRLIDAGMYQGKPFSHFDSLDASDGGNTSRYSLSGQWHRHTNNSQFKVSAYALQYDLQLFSNFTYAMERPDTGDQFLQQDQRRIIGLQTSQAWDHSLAGHETRTEIGLQVRHDQVQVGLYNTRQRQIIATTREDSIRQTQVGAYWQSDIEWTPWLRTVAGLRFDSMQPSTTAGSSSLVSPKLALIFRPLKETEFFFNIGQGFHSNDMRGVMDKIAPVPALVAAQGMELGMRTEAIPHLQSSLALWRLESNSELVYLGETGITEASNASTRWGIEWNNHWTPIPNVLIDADFAWTRARFSNGNYVPNAVDSVASVGVTLKNWGAWSISTQWRYMGSGALNEENTVRSEPVSTVNLRLSRDMRDWSGYQSNLSLDIFNLLNRKVNDMEYYYASRLSNESAPVEDKVVHPAESFSMRLTYRMYF